MFPEAWHEFARAAQRSEGERIVDAYARRLSSSNSVDRATAALDWDRWESVHISLDDPDSRGIAHEDPVAREAFATLVTHYWAHDGFLPGEQAILARVHSIGHVPAVLIHGRRDISGPVVIAWRLHQQWPASTLTIVEDEAHGGTQELTHLADALDGFARS